MGSQVNSFDWKHFAFVHCDTRVRIFYHIRDHTGYEIVLQVTCAGLSLFNLAQ